MVYHLRLVGFEEKYGSKGRELSNLNIFLHISILNCLYNLISIELYFLFQIGRRQRDSRVTTSTSLPNNKNDANGDINSSTHSEGNIYFYLIGISLEIILKCFAFDASKSIAASFLTGQASSDSHTGDSDFCYPAATACCLCLPPASAFGSNMSSSRRGHNRYQYHKGTQRSHQHRSSHQEYLNRNQQYFHQPVKHSMVIATVFVFFTVAFVGLSYFAFNLQGQISTLSMHLEPGKYLE